MFVIEYKLIIAYSLLFAAKIFRGFVLQFSFCIFAVSKNKHRI
jgi:hypothetical protein